MSKSLKTLKNVVRNATKLIKQEDFEEAFLFCKSAAKLYGDEAQFLLVFGVASQKNGDADLAVKLYQKVVSMEEIDPKMKSNALRELYTIFKQRDQKAKVAAVAERLMILTGVQKWTDAYIQAAQDLLNEEMNAFPPLRKISKDDLLPCKSALEDTKIDKEIYQLMDLIVKKSIQKGVKTKLLDGLMRDGLRRWELRVWFCMICGQTLKINNEECNVDKMWSILVRTCSSYVTLHPYPPAMEVLVVGGIVQPSSVRQDALTAMRIKLREAYPESDVLVLHDSMVALEKSNYEQALEFLNAKKINILMADIIRLEASLPPLGSYQKRCGEALKAQQGQLNVAKSALQQAIKSFQDFKTTGTPDPSPVFMYRKDQRVIPLPPSKLLQSRMGVSNAHIMICESEFKRSLQMLQKVLKELNPNSPQMLRGMILQAEAVIGLTIGNTCEYKSIADVPEDSRSPLGKAEDILKKALSSANCPPSMKNWGLVRLGWLITEENRNGAYNTYNAVIEKSPSDPLALVCLADLLCSLGDKTQFLRGIGLYEKVSKMIKDDPHGLRAGQVHSFIRLGEIYARQDNKERSEEMFLKAVSLDPLLPGLGRKLCESFIEKDMISEATSVLKNLCEDQNDGWAWKKLAEIQLKNNELPDAQRALHVAIRCATNDWHLWICLGRCYQLSRKIDSATKSFTRAIELIRAELQKKELSEDEREEFVRCLCWLSQCVAESDLDFALAVEYLDEALVLDPECTVAWFHSALMGIASAEKDFLQNIDYSAYRNLMRCMNHAKRGLDLCSDPELRFLFNKLIVDASVRVQVVSPTIVGGENHALEFNTFGCPGGEHLVEFTVNGCKKLKEFLLNAKSCAHELVMLRPHNSIGWHDIGVIDTLLKSDRLDKDAAIAELTIVSSLEETMAKCEESKKCNESKMNVGTIALRNAVALEPFLSIHWNAMALSVPENPLLQQHCLMHATKLESNEHAWINLAMLMIKYKKADAAKDALIVGQYGNVASSFIWAGHGLVHRLRLENCEENEIDEILEKMTDAFECGLIMYPQASMCAYLSEGLIKRGQFDNILGPALMAVKKFPTSPSTHSVLGQAYANKNLWDRALRCFDNGLNVLELLMTEQRVDENLALKMKEDLLRCKGESLLALNRIPEAKHTLDQMSDRSLRTLTQVLRMRALGGNMDTFKKLIKFIDVKDIPVANVEELLWTFSACSDPLITNLFVDAVLKKYKTEEGAWDMACWLALAVSDKQSAVCDNLLSHFSISHKSSIMGFLIQIHRSEDQSERKSIVMKAIMQFPLCAPFWRILAENVDEPVISFEAALNAERLVTGHGHGPVPDEDEEKVLNLFAKYSDFITNSSSFTPFSLPPSNYCELSNVLCCLCDAHFKCSGSHSIKVTKQLLSLCQRAIMVNPACIKSRELLSKLKGIVEDQIIEESVSLI